MNTSTSPENLEYQKTQLLKACLMAFNQLRNQRIRCDYPSTYALAAKIDHLLQQEK